MKLILVFIILVLLSISVFLFYGKFQEQDLTLNTGKSVENPVQNKENTKRKVKKVVHKPGTRIETRLRNIFIQNDLLYPPDKIALYAIKDEKVLEVWTKETEEWKLVIRYPILAASGKPGPKLKQGDKQVPEGIYKITELNPNSSFHLSMRVNYPNEFDLQRARLDGRNNLGGDIFIHGKAKSIGCIAIGDRAIEELFLLANIVGIDDMEIIITPSDPSKRKLVPPKGAPVWTSSLYSRIEKKSRKFGRLSEVEVVKAQIVEPVKIANTKFDIFEYKFSPKKFRKIVTENLVLIIICFLTIIINFWIYLANRKITLENSQNLTDQEVLQYKAELRRWANDVILRMNETVLICNSGINSSDMDSRLKQLNISLSSLVDSGMMFLPVSETDKRIKNYNSDKNGFADTVLDLVRECRNLVAVINSKGSSGNLELQKNVLNCKDSFVAEITRELHN